MQQAPAFTARQRSTLDALCRRIVPAAFAHVGSGIDLPAAVEERLVSGDTALRNKFAILLTLFGLVVRFETLSDSMKDRVLNRWERSRWGLQRTIFQAFRRVILSTYYPMPESHAGM